jgi:hypothetical protein
MRVLFGLLMVVIPVTAQHPLARIVNASHPTSNTFQVGDRFEVLVTGAPNQPVSVRMTINGRTDWSPVIGTTDGTGRWSTVGQFEKRNFGSWREAWTVGDRLASPVVEFSVGAPCLPGGQGMASIISGPNVMQTCETAEGSQSFSTSSRPGYFRAAGARPTPWGSTEQQTQDLYQMEILQDMITQQQPFTGTLGLRSSRGGLGDETAKLITNLIGVNGLSEGEIRNVLSIIRLAFARPENIAPGLNFPGRSLKLVRHLADLTDDSGLQQQITETMEYLQTR